MRQLRYIKDSASSATHSYAYEASSNRLQSVDVSSAASGVWTEKFIYTTVGSTASHTGGPANYSFAYDARGRLTKSTVGALIKTYVVNAFGQRVLKANPVDAADKTHFVYDEAGHLIGEYDATGNVTQETVWLGDLPIATLQLSGNYFIAPDHLGAPHQISNAVKQVVWLWDHDPFGNGAPTGSQPTTFTSPASITTRRRG